MSINHISRGRAWSEWIARQLEDAGDDVDPLAVGWPTGNNVVVR